jgi:hypothetical protein
MYANRTERERSTLTLSARALPKYENLREAVAHALDDGDFEANDLESMIDFLFEVTAQAARVAERAHRYGNGRCSLAS